MPKSIAELRASAHVGLPEWTYRLCLATKILGEIQSLVEELRLLEETEQERAEGKQAGPKRRAAEKAPGQQLRARIAELRQEMDEHTGTLTFRGVDDNVWRRWKDAHPARPGNERDSRIGHGFCNADDLVDALGTFVVAWNGEELKPPAYDAKGELTEPGDWEFFRASAAPGDLNQMAVEVIDRHETVVDLPKLSSALRGIQDA